MGDLFTISHVLCASHSTVYSQSNLMTESIKTSNCAVCKIKHLKTFNSCMKCDYLLRPNSISILAMIFHLILLEILPRGFLCYRH